MSQQSMHADNHIVRPNTTQEQAQSLLKKF